MNLPPPLPFPMLAAEDGVLVVDKPAGMSTSGRDLDEPGSAQWHLMQAHRRMIWAVHQLDRDTSGVNVFVRRRTLVAPWQQALAHPQTTKTYVAVADGPVPAALAAARDGWQLIDAPIGSLGADRWPLGVTPTGRPARSRVRVLAASADTTLLLVRIETGRTHQVRIHLAHAGLTLLGEPHYGRPNERLSRHALHAWRLTLGAAWPQRTVEAPLPPDLRGALEAAGLPAFDDALRAAGEIDGP